MQPTLPLLMFMSILFPAKLWVVPGQSLMINVKNGGDCTLVMTDFAGHLLLPTGDAGSNDGDVHESSKCATAVWRCCNLRRALSSVHLAVPLSGTLFWESGSLRIGA